MNFCWDRALNRCGTLTAVHSSKTNKTHIDVVAYFFIFLVCGSLKIRNCEILEI
jgi:hypothetical protein